MNIFILTKEFKSYATGPNNENQADIILKSNNLIEIGIHQQNLENKSFS
jgi:hypothetical protein